MTPLFAFALLFTLIAAFAIAYAWFGPKESVSEVLRAGDTTGLAPLVSINAGIAAGLSHVDGQTFLDHRPGDSPVVSRFGVDGTLMLDDVIDAHGHVNQVV